MSLPTPNDGGPAFPGPATTTNPQGMTLRDWFAGQSLTGLLLAPGQTGEHAQQNPAAAAAWAYQQADEMLKAREAKP